MILNHKKKNNFTQINNGVIQHDFKISWRALGLLTYLCSLPPNWTIKIENLTAMRSEGRDAIRTALNELESAGYLIKRGRKRMENGKLGEYMYDVFDYIAENPHQYDSLLTENHVADEPKLDNPTQVEASKIAESTDVRQIDDDSLLTENPNSSINGISVKTENPCVAGSIPALATSKYLGLLASAQSPLK